AGDDSEAWLQILEFQLANERYGIETRYLAEVHPLHDLAPLPCTPAFIRGIATIRGRITAIIDIKQFFELPDPGLTDMHRIILVRAHGVEVGILADVVVGIRKVAIASMQANLATLTGIRGEYMR